MCTPKTIVTVVPLCCGMRAAMNTHCALDGAWLPNMEVGVCDTETRPRLVNIRILTLITRTMHCTMIALYAV